MCIAFCDRRPEYLEIVTLNTAFPDLLQRHMANCIERRTRREGDSDKGNPVPEIGRFHTLDEVPVCEHHCLMWCIPAVVAYHLLLLLLRLRLCCHIL